MTREKVFYVDSGGSSHIVNSKDLLVDSKLCELHIAVAQKGSEIKSEASGLLKAEECGLKNVLFVPDLAENLLPKF